MSKSPVISAWRSLTCRFKISTLSFCAAFSCLWFFINPEPSFKSLAWLSFSWFWEKVHKWQKMPIHLIRMQKMMKFSESLKVNIITCHLWNVPASEECSAAAALAEFSHGPDTAWPGHWSGHPQTLSGVGGPPGADQADAADAGSPAAGQCPGCQSGLSAHRRYCSDCRGPRTSGESDWDPCGQGQTLGVAADPCLAAHYMSRWMTHFVQGWNSTCSLKVAPLCSAVSAVLSSSGLCSVWMSGEPVIRAMPGASLLNWELRASVTGAGGWPALACLAGPDNW